MTVTNNANATTFVELLAHRARLHPDRLAFRYLSYTASGVEEQTITYQALHTRARLIAQHLLSICQPGDRALMLYSSGIDFIAAYFGCLLAGVIAVPGYPPKRNQKLGRLKSLVDNCQARVALTDAQTRSIAQPQFGEVDALQSLAWLITDTLTEASPTQCALPQIAADDIAFLQYTSGSTGDPKGVMVTHGNLIANSRSIYEAMGHDENAVIVGWLPLFHDMGLIGNLLQPIFIGCSCTFMSPASFLQRPLRWLEAISTYKATTSGGPNFGYDLCVSSIKDAELAQLDLSSWRVAFNGAEPIRPESVKAFSEKFAACGFDSRAHYACYGMAETTLLITGGEAGQGMPTTCFDEARLQANRAVVAQQGDATSHALVNCGHARREQGVLIVDPVSLQRCTDGAVGEIWAYGDSNAKGYWQNPEATAATFAAYTVDGAGSHEGPYLRTGDLGFLHDGALYIAGRLKDVVIIRGMNHYPQDIELTAFESHAAFMPNGAAVFTIEDGGQEQLVVVLEVRRTFLRNPEPQAWAMAIQQAVVLQHELQLHSIVFIKPGQLPKTSSGKVQRQACKQQYLANAIQDIGRVDKIAAAVDVAVDGFDRAAWQAQSAAGKLAMLENHLADVFEVHARLAAGTIKRDAPFIGYGLDSLALTQVGAKIAEDLDVHLQVQHLFECESIVKLAAHLHAALLDPAHKRQRILPAAPMDGNGYPLSYAQQRMWFLMQMAPSALYNIYGLLRILGNPDIAALDKSFQEVFRRHDALRTRFVEHDFQPYQVVTRETDWKLSLVDLSDRSWEELEAEIGRELQFVFNLSEDILFRATLYKEAEGSYALAVCMHHIISDGWSVSVLMNEVAALYAAYTKGEASPLEALTVQYPDYAAWQREYLQGAVLEKQQAYWQARLKDVTPLALPLDKIRPTVQTFAGHAVPVHLDKKLTRQLKAFSKEHNVTLYMSLLAGFAALLHKLSGQDDICIGTPIANRTLVETKNLMGFFVNTLALRTDLGGNPLFSALLQQVKTVTVDAYAHQDLPFEKVVDLVQVERDLSTSPLFQVMFVLQETGSGSLSLPGVVVENDSPPTKTAKFDVTLELREGVDGLSGCLEYKTDLFDAATIERMALYFKRLLTAIVATPDVSVGALSLLNDADKQALLAMGNVAGNAENSAFAPQCSHVLFEEQAHKTPHAVALECNGARITYQELNLCANQLAHYLTAQGVRPDTLVGLCVDRSPDMVIGLLAILKAGGAYVAFDPAYPQERLRYLLDDSGVVLIVTQEKLAAALPLRAVSAQKLIFIDNPELFSGQSTTNIAPADIGLTPQSLAYVIYTSGSTGNPKASLLMHQGLSNLALAQKEFFRVDAGSRVIQFASFAFDAATSEIFMALCAGAALHIVSKEVAQSGADLSGYVAQHRITHATLPPALLPVLEQAKWASVDNLVVAGEHCPIGLVRDWAQGRHFYNAYGPSETTVCASIARLSPTDTVAHMGKPMRGVQLVVLDRFLQPAPVGVPGQLFVGGRGVGRGYLRRDALNAEKFIDNPFGDGKLYASGDLVRWLGDGNLEFIGRLDNQVKIRGFRIELGEIEEVLSQQDGVADSVVIAHGDKDGNQQLVAYLVVQQADFSIETLRNRLMQTLPAYMVPSVLMPIDRLPLTANGKIDRKALPAPDLSMLATVDYVAPRSATEQALAAIWCTVLQLDRIGVQHDFFALGGHSLLAIQVISRIKQHFGVQLKVADLFTHTTIASLAALLDAASEQVVAGAAGDALQRIQHAPRDGVLPLSYAQQRMWIVNQIDAGSAQYNMPAAIDFNGVLNVAALERALDAFVDRHEIVRTVYAERNGMPYQVIRDAVDFSLCKIDLSSLDADAQTARVAALTQQEALTPFDLARDLMLRATLLRRSERQSTLLITIHHIASDGWSTTLLVQELNELYNAFAEHRPPALPVLACQYADYAVWQRQELVGEKLTALLSWWRDRLHNLPTVHNLPLDHARPAVQSHRGGVVVEAVAPETAAGLRQLAQDHGATLFMVLHAAFAGLLHRYSGEADIVLGTPVANRELTELEPLVGLFVNTLVVRSDLSDNPRFIDLLAQSKSSLLAAYEHQDLPFEMLVNDMQLERSQRLNPLFQIMLAFQSGSHNELHFSGLGDAGIKETAASTKFDLTLNVLESEQGIRLTWEFARDLFEEATIRRMSAHFARLLAEVVKAPAATVGELPLLDDGEKHQLLHQWNDTATAYPTQQTLHHLFEAQAAATPERVALVFDGTELSYAELNGRANRLAHYLRSRGVGPDVPVGICAERSIEMVVGLYGILKAGGAYVPFDPAYPKDRLAFMIEDADPPVLLTQSHLLQTLPVKDVAPFCLDTGWPELAGFPATNPAPLSTHNNLAYVIYTSGSTGRPKGVAIEHAGIVNRLQWMQQAYCLSADDRVLQKTPFSFDVSVWEFFWPLLYGSTLVVAKPGGHQDVQYLAELIAAQSITTMHFVPPMLEVFLTQIEPQQCRSLRQVMCSGQALPLELQHRFFALLPEVALHNLYGPTEASVDVTYWQCRDDAGLQCVPIGKPIANIQIHILDAFCNPVPLGVAGELHIAGIGLARGYLNRPELTAEKFIRNPFDHNPHARMYKSGDLVRYLPDGNIEYLGRIDDQVKIRGFRIELGEIEAALAASPLIRDVIVLAREVKPGDRRLVAYVVPHNSDTPPSASELRAILLQSLPEYMVPAYFVSLDSMPLTTNGKVDRKALPEPDLTSSEVAYVAPSNSIEEKLAEIWNALLGRSQTGVHHNFFELGGHSLLAIQAISRIKEALGVQLKVADIFVHPSIASLAEFIAASPTKVTSADRQRIEKVARDAPLALSYAQERLWIVNAIDADSAQYNMPGEIAFTGHLNAAALERALRAFTDRHEILRTVYAERGGVPYQVVLKPGSFKLTQIDLSQLDHAAQTAAVDAHAGQEAATPFNLVQDLMIRATLLRLSESQHTLLITLHHIANDGWSRAVLIAELSELYNAFSEDRENTLPAMTCQYADYAAWQRQNLTSAKLDGLLSYWTGQLDGLPTVHNFPLDHARPLLPSFRGGVVEQHIPADISAGLKALARDNNATLFMVVHAAFACLLNRYSGERDIVVGTPIANRDMVELESLVGLFVNTLVLRSDVAEGLSYLDLLEQSKSRLLQAYAHQDLPFEMLVNALQAERSQSFNPLFQIMLVLQGGQPGAMSFNGLTASAIKETAGSTKFDLTVNIAETADGVTLTWEYAQDLFEEATLTRLTAHFNRLLAGIVQAPAAPIDQFSMLDAEEIHTIVDAWNDTTADYPKQLTLQQLFEAQVARTPDHAALVFEDTTLSYAELNGRANQLAAYLRNAGVGLEVQVGICAERSIEMVVGLYGILKAGGAYVPFDPAYPKDRLAFMMEDAKPAMLLTQQHLLERLPSGEVATFCLDTQWDMLAHYATDNQASGTSESNLAYVIYTSGSTGRPKGVGIEHAGIVNRLQWMQQAYPLSGPDRVMQKTPFSFDVSVGEFFGTLSYGATLVLARPGGHQDVQYLAGLIASQAITSMHFVPPMMEVFLSEVDAAQCSSLRQVLCSGQALPLDLQQRFFARLGNKRLLNLYGPTEASVEVTFWECRNDTKLRFVPIGKPIANIQIHILDPHCTPVPVGVAGELHIAGIGLAREYMNRPELTAEKFIHNPFSKNPAARMYKSGDLARYLPDGTIEYLGRIDDQVKINGLRIELGEIESALAAIAVVRDVIVMAREDAPGEKRLVAYVVPQELGLEASSETDHRQPTVAELRDILLRSLPDYMVPAHFVFLERMPLSTNGKVDRKALPAPDNAHIQTEYLAPRNDMEAGLVAIWSELLERDQIGVRHNFFELGGHSLLAVRVVSRIKDRFGKSVALKDVFLHTTIESLAAFLEKADAAGAAGSSGMQVLPAVTRRSGDGLIPLSLDQKPYWFLHQLEGGSYTYNIPLALRLTGEVQPDAFQTALRELVNHHQALRTTFPIHEGEPAQKIITEPVVELPLIDVHESVLLQYVTADFKHVFDLEHELPIRARLLKVSDGSFVLTLVVHHAVADGWSINLLIRELTANYNRILNGQPHAAPLSLQYSDYSEWQRQHVIGPYYDSQIDFWKKKLDGLAPLLNLPIDYARPPAQSFRGKQHDMALPLALTEKLNQFARQHNSTLFNVLLSGLAILLSRYGRTTDIPVGTAIANRPQQEMEEIVGCFANTLVIRCRVDPKQNFEQLLSSISMEALESFSHGSVPFDGVVEAVQPVRSMGIPPIFQVMLRLHNQEMSQTESFTNIRSELVTIDALSAKLDLNFSLVETPEGVAGGIEYATDLFSEQTIKRIAAHFQTILEAAVHAPTTEIEKLSVLTREEMQQVQEWNATEIDYPQHECMHHLFERTVQRTPNKLAYVCGDDRFTYAELNAKANRLAHFLQSRGVGPEVRVGISVERSTWAGVGCLGVLKSGGTYVPLDANYPKDRINNMLDVAAPAVILTLSSIRHLFSASDAEIICLDTEWDGIQSQPVTNPPAIGAAHSAYILFTSGTTGKPKGILISHHSFRNVAVTQRWAGLHSSESRVLQFASLSFSIALWGAFMAWVPGGTLFSISARQGLIDDPLFDLLDEAQITHVTWPVSLLSTLPIERMPQSLRTVISSAEPCNDAVVAKWTAFGCRFLNLYGNSEVSLGSTLYEYHKVGEKLTIGMALPNTKMYLLDENLKQVPIGVIAEIHTAGVGLATCYVNNPGATALSFIPNPFNKASNNNTHSGGKNSAFSRLYKTGDLGRYLPNGEIEFIGREDFQVSIRGFRVELTEIEDVLRTVPGILEVVVVSRNDQQGIARLVCFYTQAASASPLQTTRLRQAVAEKLPNYMVPSLFIALDAMPLTPNRKIDRMALPASAGDQDEVQQYAEPQSPLEKSLAAIWSGILDIKHIGIRNDFFELGGHSLLATKIVARIRADLQVNITLQEFFENSTIENLAKFIASKAGSYVDHPIKTLANRDQVPLSFAQQRLWFLDRYEENSNFYHMPTAMKIVGALDQDALKRAFVTIVERHEGLRTNFLSSDGVAYQKINPADSWNIEIVALEGATMEERENAFARCLQEQLNTSFDLTCDPLLRVVLYRMDDNEYRLFINMHHIISDGWSITVLTNEFIALYSAYVGQTPAALPDLPVQYADYSAWQIEYLQGEVLAKQSRYWREQLQDISTLPLPIDFERPKNQTFHGDRIAFDIDQATVSALEALSNREGVTMFMTLLSAFNVLLHKYSGHNDISIGTPIANRVRAEIEPLIGFFANTLVLRTDIDGNPDFAGLLQQVKNTTLGAYSHQDLPFEKVVDLVMPERDPSRSPLFQVSFALQSFPDARFDLPGITIDTLALENKTAKFDLYLEFATTPNGMSGHFEYNTDLFMPETIRSYIDSLSVLLKSIAADPQRRVSELSLSETDGRQSGGTLSLAQYPVLQAVYGDALALPVGDPVAYCILDDKGHAAPSGVIGRLHLAHKQAWLPTTFQARQVRGELVLLSSSDQVAYIHQSLVYPGAVEQGLRTMPGIRDCHVAVRHHAVLGEQLLAYVVCEGDAPDAQDMTHHLQSVGLAGAVIYASVKIDQIPTTKYGDVNVRLLRKLAVHTPDTRTSWAEKIRENGKVRQAIVVGQPRDALQTVSHVDDLLPPAVRQADSGRTTQVSKARTSTIGAASTVPAIVMGGAIDPVPSQPVTLADLIVHAAAAHADKNVVFYHGDGACLSMSYAQLLDKAQRVLTGLRDAGLVPATKVIFQFDRNEDFVVAFWACALGGLIPVPIAAAKDYKKSNTQTAKVAHAWHMMDQAVVLAGDAIVEGVRHIAQLESIDNFRVLDIKPMHELPPASAFHRGASDEVALIMLTSGSTGLPKGVQLSHANLIGRTLGSAQKNGFHSGMVSLNWMALDHVGGIIYFHIRDTYLGAEQLQVATDYILVDPLRWLQLIDRHRVNVTWAPNFAFSLIVDRQDALKKSELDLSCMHFMLNGAEAVVPKTTQAFIELLQQFKLPHDAVRPVYGMSEISSGITYSQRLNLTYGSDDTVFVSVGGPIPGVNLRIVDEHDQLLMEGASGRLQVSGVTVTKGYLGKANVNDGVFTGDGWFKTGDLAFLENGELTITGREKDVIIINGVNFYSHEIESVVEELPQVVVSYTGACAVRRSDSNSDQLAVFFHTAVKGDAVLALIRSIRQAVIEKIGVNPSYIVPLEKDSIPKTEIGKIQLTRLSQAFNRGDFDAVLKTLDIAEQNEHTLPDWFFTRTWVQKNAGNAGEQAAPGTTLLFADGSGCASRLLQSLTGEVLVVSQGSDFVETDNGFQINAYNKDHYLQLVASLQRRSIVIGKVVNLWDYDSIVVRPETLLRRARLTDGVGMYSAWHLANAFAQTEAPPAMQWIWGAKTAQAVHASEQVNPDRTACIALLKTLPKEYPWLTCRHVDFEGDDVACHAAQLTGEIQTSHSEDEVAFRQAKRFAARLQKEKWADDANGAMPIASGAPYLITGGLGGIAYELAKVLLKQFNAKLLLIGRAPAAELSAQKRDMLDELSALGSVQYTGADVCNHAEVEAVVNAAEDGWKQRLAGVFHLAGVLQEQTVAEQSIEGLHDAMRAKTLGTRVLYAICNDRSQTLFVNFSSVNGYFGGAGMAAYSIGNLYQASFVNAAQHNKNVNSYCIGWSLWHDTGMGSQYKQVENLSRALGFRPIPAAKGMLSLLTALYHGHGRRNVLIGLDDTKPNINRLVANLPLADQQLVCYFSANEEGLANDVAAHATLQDEFALPLHPQFVQVDALPIAEDGAIDIAALRQTFSASLHAKAEKVAPRDEIEETLVKIASQIFGAHEPIGVKDNFFDVGANSLLIVKLHHEIQLALHVEFPMVELFNSTTVEKLAVFLSELGSKTSGSSADAARAAGQDRRAAMQRRNQGRNRKRAV